MEKFLISANELDGIIAKAVKSALESREKVKDETTLISREATASRLGVAVSTLWRWDKSGYFKVSTHIGRACWYLESDIKRIELGRIK